MLGLDVSVIGVKARACDCERSGKRSAASQKSCGAER